MQRKNSGSGAEGRQRQSLGHVPGQKKMFFRKRNGLSRRLKRPTPFSSVRVRGFPPLRDLHIPGNAFTGISVILKQSTVFMICIPAAFMLIPLRKSTGRTGAGISRSTVMKMPKARLRFAVPAHIRKRLFCTHDQCGPLFSESGF